ncbi:PREDICTED: pollen receptor-like kinase 1 [Camelina sativa]|uniref:Pollen receptor-like kinase 1 n=1 Tax=Camelina sativa TaxID=90675 RepID=A0ABM0V3W3_CAMSA|nr:PREDICTED: pollen receptor-like kinase 1 [Camelina sativa]
MHPMQARCLSLYIIMVPLVCLLLLFSTATHGLSNSEAILNIKKSLVVGQANALASWDAKTPPCTWPGVLCNSGSVWGLQIENLELSGSIDIEALSGLTSLRTLSFRNNKFGGPFPEFKKLAALKSLYLSNNQFEGDIPDNAFEGMAWLKKVHLAQNKFTGQIPTSVTKLPKLLELRLDGNQFTGQIPEFGHELHLINLSNNALTGPIPESLSMMDPKVFEGNKGLCGKPLETECDSPFKELPPQPEVRPKSSSRDPLVIKIIVTVLAILIILGVIIVLINRNYRKKQLTLAVETGPSSLQKKIGIRDADQTRRGRHKSDHRNGSATTTGVENTKLSFLREDREKFDLQDLLKASAEILGSGCFGASYKAVLSSGQMMVVKRFKQMNNAGRDEFQEHMKRLGRLRNHNLLPIVAYYYRKEEKLLVCDFAERGSLAVNLHSNQSLGNPSLDWPTRLKIVKGVARGLLYLHHDLPSLMAPHGHLKSSNVLLTKAFEPLLTDYGLIPLINQEKAQVHMAAYRSPEYLQHQRITKKTDVWQLGILILEILTGKFPANFSQGSEEDLASWVNLGFHGEWAPNLFDKEMGKTSHCEGQILKLLRIGLSCCEPDVEKRLDIVEAVEKIEELREQEGDDDDFYSTYVSETDGRSSKGVSSESINLT